MCEGKFHVKNGEKKTEIHANFTLLGRSAEVLRKGGLPPCFHESGAMNLPVKVQIVL